MKILLEMEATGDTSDKVCTIIGIVIGISWVAFLHLLCNGMQW